MVRNVPISFQTFPLSPTANASIILRLELLVKSLKRLKPFRWRRPLEAGEAPFLKGSRLGGGPLIGRDWAALAFKLIFC